MNLLLCSAGNIYKKCKDEKDVNWYVNNTHVSAGADPGGVIRVTSQPPSFSTRNKIETKNVRNGLPMSTQEAQSGK